MARYANCGDVDESSQAEGTVEGAVGYARPAEQPRNPHYENIYESIDQYVAGAAPVPADIIIPNASNMNNPAAAAANANVSNRHHLNHRIQNPIAPNCYRNELYDRTSGYDVPRQLMRNYAPNTCAMARRANLNLDVKQNRARYVNTMNRAHRQRSFDDTESYHYAYNNNSFRYENIYEQIREEPIYRNIGVATREDGSRVYGRLDVIGHGIGRIERHLSSSCGNIDHYNLGGHYAILGHSHLGTVGHIRLNAANAPHNAKETNGKSLNFFSCLGRENSQSLNNICPGSPSASGNIPGMPAPDCARSTPNANENPQPKSTGAIPKMRNKDDSQTYSPLPIHSSTLNRIPKSSLQWLLVNKWLPLWVGNGPDCNVVDFNFMFSRNCEGCAPNNEYHPSGEVFTETSCNHAGSYAPQEEDLSAQRSLRLGHSMSRAREGNHRMGSHGNFFYDRPRNGRVAHVANTLPDRREPAAHGRCPRQHLHSHVPNDPFHRWELNSENNSFRPAIRRITDGTFPPNRSPANCGSSSRMVRVEINHHSPERTAPAQRPQGQQPSALSEPSISRGRQHLSPAQNQTENNALSSSTESTSAALDVKVSSPEMGNRRYSENTEDDQVSSKSMSHTENTDCENTNESDDIDDDGDNDDDLTENGIDTSIRNDATDENSATDNAPSSDTAYEQN